MNEERRKFLLYGVTAAPLLQAVMSAQVSAGEAPSSGERWYWYPGHALTMKSTGRALQYALKTAREALHPGKRALRLSAESTVDAGGLRNSPPPRL